MNEENKEKQELEFNRRNREDYEKLMDESSTQLDVYCDKNNLFVKLLLIGLFLVIVVGSIIVIMSYLGTI